MCYSTLQQNNLFEITQDSPTFLRHTHINATVVCPKFEPTGVERPRREPKFLPLILSESLGMDLSPSISTCFFITSVSSDLSPTLSCELDTPSDHYPIFAKLDIEPSPRPPPKLCSFHRISSVNLESFKLASKRPPFSPIPNRPQ